MSAGVISLRGVEVHNLKAIDLDLPRRQLIVLCGLSGSGKSSLALDTLYAEGQRRYIESFSAYTRQFLERLEKPQADRIDGIPPAVAVTSRNLSRSSRATVGTATETTSYLRLLFAKIGRVFCLQCGRPVQSDTAQSAFDTIAALPPSTRIMVGFLPRAADSSDAAQLARQLRESGFVRVVAGQRTISLADEPLPDRAADWPPCVVVDRLTAGAGPRLRESLESAFEQGQGRCVVFVAEDAPGNSKPNSASAAPSHNTSAPSLSTPCCPPQADHLSSAARGRLCHVDGRPWRRIHFSDSLACEECGCVYLPPEPRLFSFNSPWGACPACEGFGNVIDLDLDLIVPDPNKSLRDGAIAPLNTPACAREFDEMLRAAAACGVPIDAPFLSLSDEHKSFVLHGSPQHNYGGLQGFFAYLERKKYKMHVRVFLSRWRSYRTCPQCRGTRLRPEALAVRIGGKNIAQLHQMTIRDARAFFNTLCLDDHQRRIARAILEQVQSRLDYLEAVGLGYLSLDRTLRTLSGGESRRVALTSALGSSLVNMLYVLDEPSIGLHPRDIDRLTAAVLRLRDRDNTVVVVEHEESMIRAADHVVEIGPGAGEQGGRIVFQGTPEQLLEAEGSLTGDYLSGRRGDGPPLRRRATEHGWIRLTGARGNNLKNITAEFPLGVLCAVTGVSGSGKSTLVQDTLYPALCRRLRKEAPKPYPHDDVFGDGQLDDVILVDQSPIGRSPRSNPVTYLKAFDEIRNVFAETVEAKTRGYTAGHFSFNVDGGRCTMCEGDGVLQIDMQFLADVYMKCPQCGGRRYRSEILDVAYRGRNIAEVLEMTVREAFTFFRGRPKVQARLKRLIDVGLDYLRLGQPANTLSGGESQRLKLAGYLSAAKRGRCLFLLDEPTTGLHFADVVQLLDCFEALLSVGHSLIVVEHNLQLLKAADYIIDLGPGAGDEGGTIVARGTPEAVARHPYSVTGQFLAQALKLKTE